MKGEQSLAQTIFHDKKLWESRARTYQECLNQIQEYLDSPSVDIGLIEYTNLSNLIKMALTRKD